MICILLSVVCLCAALDLASADPCEGYNTIGNEKRSALYTADSSEANICDQDLDESVWYRFQVLPPNRIHDQCVQEFRCGTDQPIWMSGDHPTADDPGPRQVTVCSPTTGNCCGVWKSTILVKFCPAVVAEDEAGFYVYRLKRVPDCDMAYCAGNIVVCSEGTVWNPVREQCTDLHPNVTTPVLEGPITQTKILELQDKLEYDDFYFVCAVRWSDPEAKLKKGGEQFQVVFTFDGTEVQEVPPRLVDGSNLRVRLESKELLGQVGKTVGCQVRAHWAKVEKFRSQYFVSERTYFVGIRYSTNADGPFTSPRIEIDEKSPPLTLFFQSTVPISCPELNQKTSCKISVEMADILPTNGAGASACTMVFGGQEKNNKPRTQRVRAIPTPGIHERTSVIRFKAVVARSEFFWHGYKLPDIPIFIKDSSKTGTCSSSGDPHIMTFDERYYHAYMEGDYLFARSTSSRHFEVHVRHHKCWAVTCNCAVAVREGNNVLGVNACQGPNFTPTPIRYLEDKHVPGATITNVGNVYTITMPSGAYVRMDWHGLHSSIQLYLNSEDYGKVVGLCGTFNGNAGDDTIPKGGQQADNRDIPVSFSESYKLSAEESFINGHVTAIECLEIDTQVPNICSCENKQVVACAAPDVTTKPFGTKFTQHCAKNQNAVEPNRRRRSTETTSDDWDDEDAEEEEPEDEELVIITEADMPVPVVDENHGRDVTLQWPTPGGISEAEANRLCRTKVEASPVFAACRDQISQQLDSLVKGCVTDVQVSDNVEESVSYILSDFQTQCVQKLESSVVRNDLEVQPSLSPMEKLLEQVVDNICPGMCNGNGVCNNATCSCNNGFAGEDCSVNAGNPPNLTSFRKDSLCDGRTTFCAETAIFASNIFRSEKLSCKFSVVGQSEHFTHGGSIISTREVLCRLPTVHRFTNETSLKAHGTAEAEVGPAPFYRWDIALTNDGSLYSNSLRMTVYDSNCQDCRSDGSCIQKDETCVIEGRCFKPGDTSSTNSCKKCNPAKDRQGWTLDKLDCRSSATWVSYSLKALTVAFALTIICCLVF